MDFENINYDVIGNDLLITKIGKKYRIYEYHDHQCTAGGGKVVNGTKIVIDHVIREHSGRIMSFNNFKDAEIYAKRLSDHLRSKNAK